MPNDTELVRLIYADVFRDGGSLGAAFEADDGRRYNVWLQCSRVPDADGPHHRWLFEYFGSSSPDNPLPVLTGSEEERALISRLNRFVERQHGGLVTHPMTSPLERLQQLILGIERREPCFRSDLVNRRFHVPHI